MADLSLTSDRDDDIVTSVTGEFGVDISDGAFDSSKTDVTEARFVDSINVRLLFFHLNEHSMSFCCGVRSDIIVEYP